MKRSASKTLSAVKDLSATSSGKDLLKQLTENRKITADSVLEFEYKKKRVKILSKAEDVLDDAKGIVYWMHRDCRVQDNWALLFAQKLALNNKIPLHVLFCLPPKYIEYTLRHYEFLIAGLKEVQQECEDLNINFHLSPGEPTSIIPDFVTEEKMGAIVVDFLPLKQPMDWQQSVLDQMPDDVPFVRVDAHNIVPCWIASDKQEYAARTIRNKINNQLSTYLTPFPPVIKHPFSALKDKDEIDWDDLLSHCDIDKSVGKVDWATPGYKGGIAMLESFCNSRLKQFATKRNDPCENAISNLSPWLHFGHISAQRCVLVVRELKMKHETSVNSFCEEIIIRRELSDNFCFYNPLYNEVTGAANWAQLTLSQHTKDKRTYTYTRDELEQSKTHEDLWNSAQIELVKTGKLHGFMRMYWAKKILEWTKSPEEALTFGFYFNDHFALDGNDPNGYVGVMWSMCGVHDQGWAERDIFGKIRYMNYAGCKRKFDVDAYVSRWGGKDHSINKTVGTVVKKAKKK